MQVLSDYVRDTHGGVRARASESLGISAQRLSFILNGVQSERYVVIEGKLFKEIRQ